MAAPKYQEYLAVNVLDEGKIISYRLLSRALKVHANAAKEMLYDFYQTQNVHKPGSVHASYLVYGSRIPRVPSQLNGTDSHMDEDTVMQDDSLAFSSSLPESRSQDLIQSPVTTFTLVNQERLQEVKSSYDRVKSVHIYSLEPGPLSNMHVLSDCNRSVVASTSAEDPLVTWKQYGTVYNPQAKRRGNRPPAAAATVSQPSTAAMKLSGSSNPPPSQKQDTTQSDSKAASQQKPKGSSIFNSFAKRSNIGSANPVQTTQTAKKSEDESMKDAPLESDAEEEDDEPHPSADIDPKAGKEKAEANRKAKAEREATLLKMMEEDSDPDPEPTNDDAPPQDQAITDSRAPRAAENDLHEEHEAIDNDPASAASSQKNPTDTEDTPQVQATTSNDRRRGRRRVMKKKTTKDAEGYLVTKEEPVWESFSEDEVQPGSNTKPPVSAGTPSTASKAKKSGSSSKPGQGNIMNFFGKR